MNPTAIEDYAHIRNYARAYDESHHMETSRQGTNSTADVHEIPEPSVKEQRRAQREMVREKARKEEKRRRIIADKSRRANKGK